jgi:PAS domain S-box-containing protein
MKLQGRPTLTRALHKSGRKLYVEMTFAVVKGDEGEVFGSVAMARDVTERVKRERAASARPESNCSHATTRLLAWE